MKTAVVFLGLVAIAMGVPHADPLADRSISSTVVGVIEGVRDQMPCGFPGMGIPPLAPLKIAHQEVNIDYPAIQMHGSVTNFRLNGLNDFDIAEMKVNALTSKATFRFIFNNINVDTTYDLAVVLKKAGFTINMIGNGPAKFAIKDMQIWGTLRYSLGLLSGKLSVKKLEIRTHIGEVESEIEGVLGEGAINHTLNEVIAEAVEFAVNDHEDLITDTIESIAVPMVNSILDDMPLSDMLGAIGGGSGDDTEKEACIPMEA